MAVFDEALFGLKLFSALGCGLMAGVFFAFSTFVMNALARIQPAPGIAAMQSINVAVINPLFMLVFLGTALTCLVLVVYALFHWPQPGAAWLLTGGLLYLLGTFLVTIAFNVPLNDALAKIDPTGPESAAFWADYISRWTVWNHVRTLAALAASASFIFAFYRR